MHGSLRGNGSPSALWMAEQGSANQQGCSHKGIGDSCRHPWSPASCTSMSACDVSVSAPAAIITSAVGPHSAANLPEPKIENAELTIAPELPPPRV